MRVMMLIVMLLVAQMGLVRCGQPSEQNAAAAPTQAPQTAAPALLGATETIPTATHQTITTVNLRLQPPGAS
jgi:hypothetical protein